MNKSKTKRVEKTDKLDQRKLVRIGRRYGVPPISIRELQLGHPEDLPIEVANLLIEDGFVKVVKTKKRIAQDRLNPLNKTATMVDNKIENLEDMTNKNNSDELEI